MSSVDRQNKLIAAEDWKKIYQSFQNADFKSYDFDSLRRTMITYLRENYPEDFNDYIESSEYLSLIDLISFLGQNLAFRFDLNARDNFLELAERRESVLRLARLLSYNPKRNQPANGLLKFVSLRTSESIIDSNGRDLSNQTIVWNDSSNTNWYEQFIKILNSALPENSQFGKAIDSNTISGIKTEQYRFNASNSETPVYAFSKNIDGRNMNFEIVSSSFKDSDKIFEESPFPGASLAFLYRNDGGGPASSNTGFFVHFRQGTLLEGNFTVDAPRTNESVDLDTPNINNSDVWLYSVDRSGLISEEWTKVDALEGNNVIYNSLSKDIRKIFSVLSRVDDRVRLVFSDGVFGDLPQGDFRVYYRISNGFSYTISPNNIRNVSFEVPYTSKSGRPEILTIGVSLFYTVDNASETESNDSIKTNAPASFYTQNRMITSEDYNLLPLTVNQEILKVKSINRVSSGTSRYYDLRDSSGKYSNTNLFGTDGIIYKENIVDSFKFSFNTRSDIEDIVINQIQPLLGNRVIKDFFLDNYAFISLSVAFSAFTQVTKGTNLSTGFIRDIDTETVVKKLGTSALSNLKFVLEDSMIKFVPPEGYLFSETNELIPVAQAPTSAKSKIWTKVVRIVGDGTGKGTGVLSNGLGAVTFNEVVPTGAIAATCIPRFVNSLEESIKNKAVDLIFSSKNFALRYDILTAGWKIINESNIDKKSQFSLGKTGDISNQQLDASWLVLLETDGVTYTVTYRGLRYVFESKNQIRFFFDSSDKIYDPVEGRIIRDKISVLSINTEPGKLTAFNQNFDWQIVEEYIGSDGYIDSKKISISFFDSDEDGVVDDPEIFKTLINPDFLDPNVILSTKFIFQKRQIALDGTVDFYYIENKNNLINIYLNQELVPTSLNDQQLIYIVRENLVKKFNKPSMTYTIVNDYKGFVGRDNLKFQYLHAADSSSRIDPSPSNIIDIYMLTKSYDTTFRQWIKSNSSSKPLPPSSDNLYINFAGDLAKIKAISDEIIFHPVKYKPLFGSKSDPSLQAVIKVVKNEKLVISDNDIKVGVINAIDEFFSIENWDFGDKFYFGELSTYIIKSMSPNISNIVLVPKKAGLSFGSLFEVIANSDEILVSSATVDDVEIISEITAARINSTGTVLTSISTKDNDIQSR